jgi:hypothetical protein
MKFVVGLAIAAIAIAYFGHRASTAVHRAAGSPEVSISRASELMRRAASGEPLDGRPAPDAKWVARMTAACSRRERLLSALPHSATATGIAARGTRIVEIYRAYAARVARIRPPAAYGAEGREIRRVNASQVRALGRVVAAARSGDLGRASRQSVALRELAGRANAVFLRLGLSRCAFGSSGVPL